MRATASRTALLMACQYWARDGVPWDEGPCDEDTTFGLGMHATCEGYLNNGALPQAPEDDERFRRVWRGAKAWIDDHRETWWLPEVAFAYDPEEDAARQIPKGKHRDYSSAKPTEFCGTADVVWYDVAEDVAHVYDFKTGWDVSYSEPQIRSLSLLAARAFGASRAVGHVVKLEEDLAREALTHVDGFQLSAVAGQLSGLFASIPSAEPQPGMHCTELRCPARLACPAAHETVAELVPAAALVRHKFTHEITTLEQASHILPLWKLAQAYLDKVEEALKAIARREGSIPTAPGMEWREGSRRMPRFNKTIALALLKQLGATDEQIAALTHEREEFYFREFKVNAKRGRAA